MEQILQRGRDQGLRFLGVGGTLLLWGQRDQRGQEGGPGTEGHCEPLGIDRESRYRSLSVMKEVRSPPEPVQEWGFEG